MTKIIAKVLQSEQGPTISRDKWLEVKAAFAEYAGKTIEITVQDAGSGTDPQNKYWWGVVIPHFQDAMGEHNKDDVHEALIQHLLPELCTKSSNALTGQSGIRRPSWAKLTKEQRGQCIERAIKFAATFYGVAIPDPEGEIIKAVANL